METMLQGCFIEEQLTAHIHLSRGVPWRFVIWTRCTWWRWREGKKGRAVQPLACGPSLAHGGMASSPQSSPQVRKSVGRREGGETVAINTANPPPLPKLHRAKSRWLWLPPRPTPHGKSGPNCHHLFPSPHFHLAGWGPHHTHRIGSIPQTDQTPSIHPTGQKDWAPWP